MHTIFTRQDRNNSISPWLPASCSKALASGLCLCVHSATHPASLYVVIPLMAVKPVFYQRPRIPLQQVNTRWSNARADGMRALHGPNPRRKSHSPGYRSEEAAPVIGNSEFGFAAPLTLSLDQPSRPVELRVGDFSVATSAIGSPRAGHGTRNGFVESGFRG